MPFEIDNHDAVEREVQERDALRRVAGLSTELTDVTEVEYRQLRLERVVLVGIWTSGTAEQAERSLIELARLAETAGSTVLDAFIQRRDKPDAATYIGSGKARELADTVQAVGADTVICDGELTPSQLQKLETVVGVKVVDRTWLILDIFAQHARSKEGKAQVALAQMAYMLPRLRGWGVAMSRQAGGIGTRGPGETKIETDRRRIRTRMARLRRDLKQMTQVREVKRRARRAASTPNVVIVGYTNAGKSSLLNRITHSEVLVQDELFATVDPTVRRSRTPHGREYTLTDTVGFVNHLPHQLVESFRSTLEEAMDADLLVHVVDGADPYPRAQIAAVREVLSEVDATELPELLVVNKSDIALPAAEELRREFPNAIFVSAKTSEGLPELAAAIEGALPQPRVEVKVLIDYRRGDVVARIHREGNSVTIEHTEQGYGIAAHVSPELADKLLELDLTADEGATPIGTGG